MLWTTQNYKCHIMNFSCDSVSESEKLYNFQVINHHIFFLNSTTAGGWDSNPLSPVFGLSAVDTMTD